MSYIAKHLYGPNPSVWDHSAWANCEQFVRDRERYAAFHHENMSQPPFNWWVMLDTSSVDEHSIERMKAKAACTTGKRK